ncbi:NADH-quinone oxidoreductase subunit H [Halopolyspora algeriensis]|uniref:NADH-quinone oxidoreductase subunit H n=1 Tax=Halopolyspora algeriensis TaxID=1500506 RepID=A0A368VY23_9ACTN|nr:complex I subunit 1 family protein [Halopolyspora algeriensis]RCW46217.1 NADH-quinone oxidoreductase subunit H [Halopolyspora algeriensis]TQM55620.1 NADH-quinone oxidoreductase subunit H [Halopolyspora algeriensis]
MTEVPLWSVLVLPAVLAVITAGTIAFDAVLAARATGATGSPSQTAMVPLREVARLLVAQRRTTVAADGVLWRTGVLTVPIAALLAAVVLPLGGVAVADLAVGVVWFNAMEILTWAAVWMAGWGPNSAFSLTGGYRFVAQGLAYELPHMFALITAATAAGTLRVGGIVEAQSGLWFVTWMPVAFVVYLLSAAAMAFWGPFDAPVGGDLAGGAAAELSGVDRLAFLGGRRLLLVVAAAMAVPLFLGGGNGPLLPPWLWTLVKTVAVLAAIVWLARRFPTVRMERFAEFAWVVLIPLTILQALIVALVVL